jgi:hypothetical protein
MTNDHRMVARWRAFSGARAPSIVNAERSPLPNGVSEASTAVRQLQARFPWRLRAENFNLGWVGLEPTTNALKGRYCHFVSILI